MDEARVDLSRVWNALSEPRMAPYLTITSSQHHALQLYAWNAKTASSAFEMVGHLEVLLRNAIDECLREHFREAERGIPWFFLPLAGGEHVSKALSDVRSRLQEQERSSARHGIRQSTRDSRHQIVAGMSFGFWSGMLGPKYEELWRACIHRAFPHSSGKRSDVSAALERVRKFRNRLAHHDSMLNVDVPFEVRHILQVARYIDAEAAAWIEECTAVMSTYAKRPGVTPEDTVVVAAREAWPLYEGGCHAYVCQPGRAFRDVSRLAFYDDREVKQHVPKIRHRRDNVEWTEEEAQRLDSGDRLDRKVAAVIRHSLALGWAGRSQVFLLTGPGDPDHRELGSPLGHQGRSAFTRRQRYVSLHRLETAKTTADLLVRPQ
jgi:hypothetical protein